MPIINSIQKSHNRKQCKISEELKKANIITVSDQVKMENIKGANIINPEKSVNSSSFFLANKQPFSSSFSFRIKRNHRYFKKEVLTCKNLLQLDRKQSLKNKIIRLLLQANK